MIKLDDTSDSIRHLVNCDKRMGKLISMIGDLEYEIPEEPYAFLVSQIVNQLLSSKASEAIFRRVLLLCDGNISPNAIERLTEEELKSTGMSRNKVSYIKNLTEAVKNRIIDFEQLNDLSDDEVVRQLTQIRGIGNWSAKMYLLFALDRQDILPYEDGAFLQGYKWLYKTDDINPESINRKCKKWRPYSSIAARYLYKALDQGYTKAEFHLHK